MADYAKELLDAIELLAEHKIINAGFDKTIKPHVKLQQKIFLYILLV